MRKLVLLRHPPVHPRYAGVCYGASDIELSSEGHTLAKQLAEQFQQNVPEFIFQSGLQRTRAVADHFAGAIEDARLRERNFGDWELRAWDDIYQETADAMMGMIDNPKYWRPPNGETTYELRDRVLSWYEELPVHGSILAVSHGGPIAALCGTLAGVPVSKWLEFIPKCGEAVELA
jgi:broad specificity phosphatase PhoE